MILKHSPRESKEAVAQAAERIASDIELAAVAAVSVKLADMAEQEVEPAEPTASVADAAAVACIFSTPQVRSTEKIYQNKIYYKLKRKSRRLIY